MSTVREYKFKEFPVLFENTDEGVMVNATHMAKAFPNKNLSRILNSKELLDYLQVREPAITISIAADSQYVKVVNGGNNFGTWVDEKVAIRIAQKLSPEFSVWVDERLSELVRVGFTATEATIDDMVNDPDLVISLAKALKDERAKSAKQKPKVEYFDTVLDSKGTFTATEVAETLGLVSAQFLNQYLLNHNIITQRGCCFGVYRLRSKYQCLGYSDTKTVPIKEDTLTTHQLRWTEKGIEFINGILKKNGYGKSVR